MSCEHPSLPGSLTLNAGAHILTQEAGASAGEEPPDCGGLPPAPGGGFAPKFQPAQPPAILRGPPPPSSTALLT